MKKFIEKNLKLLLTIIIVLVAILLIIVLVSVFKGNDKGSYKNKYNSGDSIDELPGIVKYDSDNLLKSHCIDNICVKNVKLYYDEKNKNGRIEYTIVNEGKKKSTGYLKLVFNDSIIIYYKDLEPKGEIQTTTQFDNKKISDKTDYKLKKLTDDEMSKIKK